MRSSSTMRGDRKIVSSPSGTSDRGHRFCSSSSVSVSAMRLTAACVRSASPFSRVISSIGSAQLDVEPAVRFETPGARRHGPVLAAGFAADVDARAHRRALQDGGDPVREEVDRMAGAEDRRDVVHEQRGLREIAIAALDGDGLARRARDVLPVSLDPGLVVAMADRAARGERAVVVHGPLARVAPEAEAQRLRRFEDDERIDGAAGTGPHRGREGGVGQGMFAEARQRAGLGTEQRGPDGFELPARELRIRGVGDRDDLRPVTKGFEVGAAGGVDNKLIP
jgi:hypothetical protein